MNMIVHLPKKKGIVKGEGYKNKNSKKSDKYPKSGNLSNRKGKWKGKRERKS